MDRLSDGGAGVGVGAVGFGCEGARPGDVAMGVWIERVLGFGEEPAGAGIMFAQGEEVRGDILLRSGEALFSHSKLVHEEKPHVVLFAGEVHTEEGTGKAA